MTTKDNIPTDDILDDLVINPNNPELRTLTGTFLGKGDSDEDWRLYLTANLNHYLEFKKDDTVHADRESNSRVRVWLRPESNVRELRIRSGPIEFLKGDIRDENLGKPDDFGLARRTMGAAAAGCSAASCFTTAGPNCRGPESPSVGYTNCGC